MRLRHRTASHQAETLGHDQEVDHVASRPKSTTGKKKEAWRAVTTSPKAHQKDVAVTPEKTGTSPRIVRVPTATPPRRLRRTTQHAPSAQRLRLRCYLDDVSEESIHIDKPSSYEDFIERIAAACQCDVLRFATTEDTEQNDALGVYLYFPDIHSRQLIDAHLYHDMILLDEEMEVRPLPMKKTTPVGKTSHQKGLSQQSNATSFSARHRFLSPDPEEDEVTLSLSTEGSLLSPPHNGGSTEAHRGHCTPERAADRQTSHLLTPPSGRHANTMSNTLSPPPSPSLLRHRHQTPPRGASSSVPVPCTPPRLATPPPRVSPMADPLMTPPRRGASDMAEDALALSSFASSNGSAVKRTAPSTPPSRRTLDGADYKTAALAPPGAPKPFSRTRIVKNLVPAGALEFQKGGSGFRESSDADYWERSYKPPSRKARNGSPTPLPRSIPQFP